MVMEYTKFDKDLANSADIKLYLAEIPFIFGLPSTGIGIIPGLSADIWRRIPLQFPPKISSDNRSGKWKDPEVPGTDPPAAFLTTSARDITVNLTYIVDGGSWTTQAISDIAKQFRGYFIANRPDFWQKLVVKFNMWRFGGINEISARLTSVSVKHGETLVAPCSVGSNTSASSLQANTREAFPLRTDITLDLKLWTDPYDGQSYQVISGIKRLTPDWY